ncbi:hypothetical protein ABW21_db0209672 [Orbilia brochopaga]|nr:hypothetical protein ABW21_db0209672 [Drechslerella brochopaga]
MRSYLFAKAVESPVHILRFHEDDMRHLIMLNDEEMQYGSTRVTKLRLPVAQATTVTSNTLHTSQYRTGTSAVEVLASDGGATAFELYYLHCDIRILKSGPSSSGKTSLSRLLRAAFTSRPAPPITCTILHGDDFYIPDSQLPLVPLGGPDGEKVQDWDCPEALDFSRFLSSVRHAKSQGGRLPDDHVSYETTHAVGVEESIARFLAADTGAGAEKIAELEKRVLSWLGGLEAARGGVIDTVVIVDGFLLFGEGVPEALQAEFDIKLMIRTPYEKAKKRREDRAGYTTMEGFWHDPPGYFELLVWPAYVKQHSYLYQDGDMDAGILTSAALERGIRTPLMTDQTLLETVEWAVATLEEAKL